MIFLLLNLKVKSISESSVVNNKVEVKFVWQKKPMKSTRKITESPMSNNKIKIATLNLCLGLKNKKLEVSQLLNEYEIDVLCLQETEIGLV